MERASHGVDTPGRQRGTRPDNTEDYGYTRGDRQKDVSENRPQALGA